MKLQLLIPTLPERRVSFSNLCQEIVRQSIVNGCADIVEILDDDAPRGVPIGTKRNNLLRRATAEYVAFIDDDDTVEPNYISSLMEGIEKGVDCCSLRGIITWNGVNPEVFEHSIRYSAWVTNDTGPIKYYRPPNHLSAIKSSIAKQFRFPEISHGEDQDWSMQIQKSGLIKTEYYIDYPIYNYQFDARK